MTRVIAHRGANHLAPQNTIPAFEKAVQLGAQGMENDVHLTRDGEIVICHDYTIDETSNGTGFISDYSYEELLRFDFGGYFSEEYRGTKIPTLAECFEVCRPMALLNVEIKSPRDAHSPIARRTVALARDMGLMEQLLISSFDKDILAAARAADPSVQTALLYSIDEKECPNLADLLEDYVGFAKSIGVNALHPFLMYMDEDYCENCHKAGLRVHPWTANKEFAIEAFVEWGCDGIITDLPDLALEIVKKYA